jgi:hypothetical protein
MQAALCARPARQSGARVEKSYFSMRLKFFTEAMPEADCQNLELNSVLFLLLVLLASCRARPSMSGAERQFQHLPL